MGDRQNTHRRWPGAMMLLLAAISLGCPEEDDGGDYDYDFEYNAAPDVQIQRPGAQAVLTEGDVLTLEGTADDYEDGVLSGSALVWTGDWTTEPLGTDSPVEVRDVPPGAWRVRLTATDSEGASGFAARSFVVLPEEYGGENAAPVARVIGPEELAVFPFGSTVVLEGTGEDPEEGTLSGEALRWLQLDLSVGGWDEIGRAARLELTNLQPGVYNYQLNAFDSFGLTGADQTGRILVYTEGTCTAGTFVVESGTIRVAPGATGSVAVTINPSDVGGVQLRLEDGVNAVADVFASRRFDPAMSYQAQEATRTLTFTARPGLAVGQTFEVQLRGYFYDLSLLSACSIPVQIEIVDGGPNTAPVVTIDNPLDDAGYYAGQPLTFEGAALDAEDGALTGTSLVWVSDVDGTIGTGTTFTRSDLSAGWHTVTLTATDSRGASTSASIRFEIVTPNSDCAEFSLALNPNPLSIAVGGSGSVGIQILRTVGFGADVTLSLEAAGIPIGDLFSAHAFEPAVTSGDFANLDVVLGGDWVPGMNLEVMIRGESTGPSASCAVPLIILVN